MKRHRSMLVVALWLVVSWPARAEIDIQERTTKTDQYRVTYWTSEQGLPQNTVTCLRQTHDGYLWIGTRNGLVRYDGVQFKVFIDEIGAANANDLNIVNLVEDKQGRLWMHSGEALTGFSEGRFQRFVLSNGSAATAIRQIWPSLQGGLWVARAKDLIYWDQGAIVRSFSLTAFGGNLDLPGEELSGVFEDIHGYPWVLMVPTVDERAWRRLDPLTGMEKGGTPEMGFGTRSDDALMEDRQGRIWVGKPDELLCWESGQLTRLAVTNAWGHFPVRKLVEGSSGQIWIISQGPVQLHRFADGQFTSFGQNRRIVIPNDVRDVLPDREGNVWFGTGSAGVYRLQPRALVSMLTGILNNMDEVYSVAPGKAGAVWLGTTYGLVRFQSNQFTVHTNTKAFTGNNIVPRVRPVLEDKSGRVWCCLDADFLHQLQNGALTKIDFPTLPDLNRKRTSTLFEDRQGSLWLGTEAGLHQRRDRQYHLWTTNDGLSDNAICGVLEDRQGALWVGTKNGGINEFKNGRFRAYTQRDGLLHQNAWPLRFEPDDSLWVGTPLGLNLIDKTKGVVGRVTTHQGLFDNLAYCLLADHRGHYWAYGNRGIWRVRQADLLAVAQGQLGRIQCVTYSEADGMASAEGNGDQFPNAAAGPNGQLWFPTTRGVVIVEPDRLADDEVAPLVVIEQVMVDQETLFQDGGFVTNLEIGNAALATPQGAASATPVSPMARRSQPDITACRLSPGRAKVLEIHYTGNTFIDSDKAIFRHRLVGYDQDWKEAGTRRVAIYTNLRPGDYRFQVVACNHHGYWTEKPAEFAFTLAPHFYDTWPFYGFCALLTAAITAAWHQNRLRANWRLQRLQHQKDLEEERSRIAKDLHDDLGATLTGIALKVEVTRRDQACPESLQAELQGFAHTIRAAVDRMREVVWTVNPHCDTLDNFSGYLCQYADGFLMAAGLRCRLDIPAILPTRPLPAETRHHLMLVAKEALNNTAKHARASEVFLGLNAINGQLVLTIQDDGCGFETPGATANSTPPSRPDTKSPEAAESGSHRGLQNMRRRIETIGGSFELSSGLGHGTRITIRISLGKHRE